MNIQRGLFYEEPKLSSLSDLIIQINVFPRFFEFMPKKVLPIKYASKQFIYLIIITYEHSLLKS